MSTVYVPICNRRAANGEEESGVYHICVWSAAAVGMQMHCLLCGRANNVLQFL